MNVHVVEEVFGTELKVRGQVVLTSPPDVSSLIHMEPQNIRPRE